MRRFVICLALLCGGSAFSAITLSQPLTRAVFQRNSQNIAYVPIQGTYTDTTRIEARVVVMDGFSGTPTDWQTIVTSPAGGTFSGTLPVSAGGWYRLEVRSYYGNDLISTKSVDRIGVGEVFITAGQSNSANYGNPTMSPLHDTISAWSGTQDRGSWIKANDPQPNADGTGGSPWSRLGDMLADHFNVPIGFLSNGVGATRVDQWVPNAAYYPKIQASIAAAGPNRFRAILWHQGESDTLADTTSQNYAKRLNSIIAQSRIDAGWNVPWGIAIVGYHNHNTVPARQEAIRTGQQMVINGDLNVFRGPDTDQWTSSKYRHDMIHFNALGLQLHADGWMQAINNYLNPWDLDLDKKVTLTDFSLFASDWHAAESYLDAHWKLNEACCFAAWDSSGNDHHGLLQNMDFEHDWVSGKIGNALDFDGVDDYVTITDYKGISGTADRTCMAWIKTTAAQRSIISWGIEQSGRKWTFRTEADGSVGVGVWDGAIKTTSSICDGQWHHVAAVLHDDGSPSVNEILLYVDGINQTTSATNSRTIDTASGPDVLLGALTDSVAFGSFYAGPLDDVRIYHAALTASEIMRVLKTNADFDKNNTVDLADFSNFAFHWLQDDNTYPAAHWPFNETGGTVTADTSGNNHPGALQNMTDSDWVAGKLGHALDFDGTDDYVQITGYKGISGNADRSCTAWIKTTSNSQRTILSWGTEQDRQKWMFRIEANGTLALGLWGFYTNTVLTVNNGQWHHVAVVVKNRSPYPMKDIIFYIDGNAQNSTSISSLNTTAGQDVMIGAVKNSDLISGHFFGSIDDVRIYDIALSPTEIWHMVNP